MRVNLEQKTMDIEARDVNYILPAYIRSYLLYSKGADPERIVFPMFLSVLHPYKSIQVPIQFVPLIDPTAIEIVVDGGNITEATEQQVAEADVRDEEIKRLKAELNTLQTAKNLTEMEAAPLAPSKATPISPANRVPKMPKSGDIGSGVSPDNMGSRDERFDKQLREDLKDELDIVEKAERPYEKKISRDAQGKPVVE